MYASLILFCLLMTHALKLTLFVDHSVSRLIPYSLERRHSTATLILLVGFQHCRYAPRNALLGSRPSSLEQHDAWKRHICSVFVQCSVCTERTIFNQLRSDDHSFQLTSATPPFYFLECFGSLEWGELPMQRLRSTIENRSEV